jgi:hypothetical protein
MAWQPDLCDDLSRRPVDEHRRSQAVIAVDDRRGTRRPTACHALSGGLRFRQIVRANVRMAVRLCDDLERSSYAEVTL